jgi:transcriptional regulator with XRE-family HTH domain
MTTLNNSLSSRKLRLLKNKELRNKYATDQIKIGLRNQLRALRLDRGLTQEELADLIGTKQSVISRIEKDPIKVGMATYIDIAKILDVVFVARFEALDSVVSWYDNPSQKKMVPRKSEDILNELGRQTEKKKGSEIIKEILSESELDLTGESNTSTTVGTACLYDYNSRDLLKVY